MQLFNFQLQHLKQIKDELHEKFPLPQDFALAQDDFAREIIGRVRENNLSFFELSVTDMNYAYSLSQLCTEDEYAELAKSFIMRITSNLFEIGLIYCQINPNNERAVALFSAACQWMKKNNPQAYDKTFVSRIGLPWSDIYMHAVEIMRIGRLTIDEFCKKYDIIPDTLFVKQIQLSYLSRCEKEELVKNEELLAGLISTCSVELLRPAIKNYTAKVRFEEMSSLVSDAISYRLSVEDHDETLGISPNMLQRIRQLRFHSVLEECVNKDSEKIAVYNSIAGMIKNVQLLTASFFAIDFGNYVVIDNSEWKTEAFAYVPQVYKQFMDNWKEKNYPEDFWPAVKESEISNARDIILGLRKTNVIRLAFSDFDMLYTKDLLSITRY